MALTKHNRLTVGDLRKLKGKRQLTMLFVETPEEAAAASAAGIDILSIVEQLWSPAMREAAGDCFVQVGLIYGEHCTYEDYLRAAHKNLMMGGDASIAPAASIRSPSSRPKGFRSWDMWGSSPRGRHGPADSRRWARLPPRPCRFITTSNSSRPPARSRPRSKSCPRA